MIMKEQWMTSRTLFCTVAVLLSGCVAHPNPSLGTADNSFIMQAASGGMAEVALGQMAQQKSENPVIRQFAAEMVADHTPADKELMAIAAKKNVVPPSSPDAARSAVATQLSALSGTAFDQQYLSSQRQDHELQIKLYTDEAQTGTDPELRAFAAKYLPILQRHLAEVQGIIPQSSRR
jgi:putative membrane protein